MDDKSTLTAVIITLTSVLITTGGNFLSAAVSSGGVFIGLTFLKVLDHYKKNNRKKIKPKIKASDIIEAERENRRYIQNQHTGKVTQKYLHQKKTLLSNIKNMNFINFGKTNELIAKMDKKYFALANRFLFLEESYGDKAKEEMEFVGKEMITIVKTLTDINNQFLSLYKTKQDDIEFENLLNTLEAKVSIENQLKQ